MDIELIRARLNLYALLQNFEQLVQLDREVAQSVKQWNVSIQFSVLNGPSASLDFQNGVCKHAIGSHPNPAIRLFFLSPRHLNKMFDGSGTPIPLKGFSRLGFLQKDFTQLTERLEYYLKPDNARNEDGDYRRINTTLTLYTAAHAIKELALLEPTCNAVFSHTPAGILQIGVLPEGPYVHLVLTKDGISVGKGSHASPTATMTFRDIESANALLGGRLDAFQAVAEQRLMLNGMIPIIDNIGLILDRVEHYLK